MVSNSTTRGPRALARAAVVSIALFSAGCLNSFDRPIEYEVSGFGSRSRGAASSPTGSTICTVSVGTGMGPGTIYDCASGGSREIRFAVSEVTLGPANLNIQGPNTTIAGESAPAPGLTIFQPRGVQSRVSASSVELRYFRIIGPGPRTDGGGESHKLFQLDGTDVAIENIAVHHVTASGADGAFDAQGSVRQLTIERCLVRDMGSGTLLQGVSIRAEISIHHNLYAQNEERQPLVRGESTSIDVRNNIVFGWNDPMRGGNGFQVDGLAGETPSVNFVGNVLVHPARLFGDSAIRIGTVGSPAGPYQLFAEDNIVPAEERDAVGNADEVPIPAWAVVATTPAEGVWADVLPDVGAGHPDDDALIEQVRTAR